MICKEWSFCVIFWILFIFKKDGEFDGEFLRLSHLYFVG